MAACPSCARELPGEFPFCPFCGAPLGVESAAGEERWMVEAITPVAARLGIEDEVRALLDAGPDSPFENVARAGIEGDESGAAALFAAMGSPTFEAHHRLAAAENLLAAGRREEGEAELERALAFYRSVGATAYLERGETL